MAASDFLLESAWQPLKRRIKNRRKGPARERPENVKQRIAKENGYTNLELEVKSGGTITGRVRSMSGHPGDAWHALAFGPVPALRPQLDDVAKFPITQDSAEGTFIVRSVRPGRWRILVQGTLDGEKQKKSILASPGDNVAVTLGSD